MLARACMRMCMCMYDLALANVFECGMSMSKAHLRLTTDVFTT